MYIYIYVYDIVIPLLPPSPPRRVCVLCVGAVYCLLVFLCLVGALYYLLGVCIVYRGFVYLASPPLLTLPTLSPAPHPAHPSTCMR